MSATLSSGQLTPSTHEDGEDSLPPPSTGEEKALTSIRVSTVRPTTRLQSGSSHNRRVETYLVVDA